MRKIIAIAALVVALAPTSISAAQIVVQAEAYQSCNDIAGDLIQPAISYLNGLDYPGEWTQYQIQTADFGTYQVTLKCWGDTNVNYHFQLVTLPVQGDNAGQTIDFTFTGRGSCGS